MEIVLSGGEIAHIDDQDESLISGYVWRAQYGSYKGKRRLSCVIAHGPGHASVLMHRLIAGVDGKQVDHIDRNPLNNRRVNLRPCTHAENMRNRGMFSNNKAGFKGVEKICKGSTRWRARITFEGKRIHLGYFSTASDARAAYQRACREIHGAFAAVA